ncbi:MAG: RDD family protein [Cyanobacteria bacterium HKST-UBA04]|nr:RDD family protein [Cyanobacteria bacterium HKST-UBA04]MCA9842131.1 RDD family protein [Cyanobacteria bacterium HKST-UBA03]
MTVPPSDDRQPPPINHKGPSAAQDYQHHTIWTPEMVQLDIPFAGVARRFIARLVDEFLVWGFILGLLVVSVYSGIFLAALLESQSTVLGRFRDELFLLILIAVVLAVLVIKFIYYACFHAFNNGQTPGKMVTNIRLVTDRVGRANLWTCCIRSVVDFIDMALLSGVISFLMILVHKQEKRIADLASGTIVILNDVPPNPGP